MFGRSESSPDYQSVAGPVGVMAVDYADGASEQASRRTAARLNASRGDAAGSQAPALAAAPAKAVTMIKAACTGEPSLGADDRVNRRPS